MIRFTPRSGAPGLLPVLGLLLATGCTVVGTAPAPSPAPVDAVDAPALADGPAEAGAEMEVARLLAEGEAALDRGEAEEARQSAVDVETRLASARGSSRALLLGARALVELDRHEEALERAERYLRLVSETDEERPRARLTVAEARIRGGLGGGVEALFRVPAQASPPVRDRALEAARTLVVQMDDPVLRDLVAEAPDHPWLLPVFQVELGMRRALVGDQAAARRLGGAALALQPAAEEAERARALEEGEALPGAGAALSGALGLILSHSGPPNLRQISDQVRDGVEVALLGEEVRGAVRLVGEDDRGVAGEAEAALGRLESGQVLGVVGPLTEAGAAEARRRGDGRIPIISPTAPVVADDLEGLYSLAGPDPNMARTLARAALSEGIRDVAILQLRDSPEDREVSWFREAFEAGGGRISRVVTYPPGSASFEAPLGEIVRSRPGAVALFVPAEDLELIAPALAFYGVDDLEIPILGSSAFASEAVLSSVPTRHTDGVLTVAPHVGEGYGPLWEEFVGAYEEHFRRTLRSPVPALGYDAARILLHAARLGGGTSPREVTAGLSRIRDFPGATGTFSVEEGRLIRTHTPVRLEDRRRIPLGP